MTLFSSPPAILPNHPREITVTPIFHWPVPPDFPPALFGSEVRPAACGDSSRPLRRCSAPLRRRPFQDVPPARRVLPTAASSGDIPRRCAPRRPFSRRVGPAPDRINGPQAAASHRAWEVRTRVTERLLTIIAMCLPKRH
jgi:hypothetical protein